ncbi:MAG: hypothetical protein LBN39_02605 [Planctomycetaceae bacterium]|jgi:CheY-like chemotaxis protein|nr:hypothetical protein [Planctomycetaceae bacterium]
MTNNRFAIILSALLLFPLSVSAQSSDPTEDVSSPFAFTAAEKVQLLDKAQETLRWHQTLDKEAKQNTVPPPRYRKHISPLELMQAAAILKEKSQPDLSRSMREILPYFQITPAECFEIAERLGTAVLDSFQNEKEILGADTPDSTTRIKSGAAAFLKESLRPAEKIALMEEPKTGYDIMKAVNVLAVAGRPVLTRYYLNQFLALEVKQEECEKIVRKIGSAKLMQIAGNKNLAPQGEKAVSKIFSTLGTGAKPLSDAEKKDALADVLKSGDAAALAARANDYIEKNRPLRSDADGRVLCWVENGKDGKAQTALLSVPAAYREYAYRCAKQAYSLDTAFETLYYLTAFERAAHKKEEGKEYEQEAVPASLSPSSLERILTESLKREQYGAAQVAATLLGEKGKAETQLNTADGQPSPLVLAVVAKNRSVRFAAAEAVMKLKPQKPYPGSSFVSETLTWFSRADGRKVLVSAHPNQTDAMRTAGHFIACGYKSEIAKSCKEAMRAAADSPDVELVVVDLRCADPPVPSFVQELRNDARTAEIPVAVLTDDKSVLETAPVPQTMQSLPAMQKIDRLLPDNPFAVSLSLPYPLISSDEAAKWVNTDLLEKTGANPVPPEKRIEQAKQALSWILEIIQETENGQRVYHFETLDDTVSRALRSDVRLTAGLPLAAAVKSGTIQNSLYNAAADIIHPLEVRRKAADYFIQSIEKYGVLLRGQQVQRLYDRYNASAEESKESQELLGKILDAVEKKTLKK